MRELCVPHGLRKNTGQFIGIHFVLPHAVADNDRMRCLMPTIAADLCDSYDRISFFIVGVMGLS